MSNKKKKKAKNQPANSQVLGDVFLGVKTLLSNDACIKVSREWKGWRNIFPIILALGSVVLALVPYFVQQNKVQGASAVLTSPTGNYENGLAEMVHALSYDPEGNKRATPINLEITAEGKLKFENATPDFLNADVATEKWFTLSREIIDTNGKPVQHIVFEAFFNTSSNITDSEFFEDIDTYKNPFNHLERDPNKEINVYQASYIAFGKEFVRFRRRNEMTTATGLTGSYELLKGTNITTVTANDIVKDVPFNTTEYINKVRDYFYDVVNKSYEPAKQKGIWMYTGIFFGVDAGAIILFGLMLFLMTRGKRNPFRIFTFWETQKMAYWAAPTPALLSLIGFAIPNMAFILFFFIFGFRMMWMSMKSIRPQA